MTTSPCLGCGAPVRRQRSLPLCREDSRLAFSIFRVQTRGMDVIEYGRAHSRFYGQPAVVAAALAQARAERAVGAGR
jgi:hypothetical protein